MSVGPEKQIGSWRGSRAHIGFWLRTILTLGVWYLTVWRYNEIVLTTRRVTQKRGHLLSINETSMSIENITDVTVNKSVLGSLFKYGDINIQSAGSGTSEISYVGLHDPDRLRDSIFDLRDGRFDETRM